MVNKFTQFVEILCKTLRKTTCNLNVKTCEKFIHKSSSCVKPSFPTKFSHQIHQLFHKTATSDDQLFYPLFHTPYNNNY